LVTGHGDDDAKEMTTKVGFDYHIVKDFRALFKLLVDAGIDPNPPASTN